MLETTTYVRALATALAICVATPALAYIGPGASAGAIFTVVAVLLGFLFLAIAFIWFPLKRAIRNRKQGAGSEAAVEDTD